MSHLYIIHQESWECRLHDGVDMNSKTAFNPLNYVKLTADYVIKFNE